MKQFILNITKLISLVFICLLVAFVIVFPLYLIATKFNNFYTIASLFILLVFGIYFVLKICKKKSLKKNIVIALFTIIILCGLYATFVFIFQEKRLLAIISLLITPILCILTHYLLKIRNEK